MINKIVAIQGNHPTILNPKTDTSVFLANEVQKKKYRDPKHHRRHGAVRAGDYAPPRWLSGR